MRACRGIPTEDLETDGANFSDMYVALKESCDALIAATRDKCEADKRLLMARQSNDSEQGIPGCKTAAEMLDEHVKKIDEMRGRVIVDDDGFTFVDGGDYFIAHDRIANHEAILCWVMHLAGKRWFTQDLCRYFMAEAVRRIGSYPKESI